MKTPKQYHDFQPTASYKQCAYVNVAAFKMRPKSVDLSYIHYDYYDLR